MAKNKYIKREDGKGVLIHSNDANMYIELKYILKDYKYIKKAIKKENHIFERPYGDFFKEIVYDNKVVGFAMYELYKKKLILNEIYILPKFRKYDLFIRELSEMCISGSKPCIFLAKKDMVKTMMKEDYAVELEDGIVISSFEFAFSDDDALCSDNNFYGFDDFYFTPFFDLKINSAFLIENNRLFYHVMNENDLKEYGFLRYLNDEHFNYLRKCINQNLKDIEEIIKEMEDNLPQTIFSYDTILGDGDELSEFMNEFVNQGFFDRDRAIELRDILREDYKNGFIDDGEIILRMCHLVTSGSNERLDSEFDMGEFEDEALDHIWDELDDDSDLILGDREEDDFNHENLTEEEKSILMRLFDIINEDEELFKRFKDAYVLEDLSSLSEVFLDAAEDAGIDASFLSREVNGPVSYDLDVFRVLSAVEKWEDYEDLRENIELECGMSFDSFAEFLIGDDYLKIIDSKDWNDYSSVYTIDDLKVFLKESNLRTSGKKQELIDRLNDNKVETRTYAFLTDKGKTFLKEYAWIEFYENFLEAFDFNDFYVFYEKIGSSLYDVSLDFLNMHMKWAIDKDDEDYILICNTSIKAIEKEGRNLLDSLGLE